MMASRLLSFIPKGHTDWETDLELRSLVTAEKRLLRAVRKSRGMDETTDKRRKKEREKKGSDRIDRLPPSLVLVLSTFNNPAYSRLLQETPGVVTARIYSTPYNPKPFVFPPPLAASLPSSLSSSPMPRAPHAPPNSIQR